MAKPPTTNAAGILANSEWRVLAVDLDRQGNLQKDLGYREDDRHDQGEMLFRALTDDDRHLEPVLTEQLEDSSSRSEPTTEAPKASSWLPTNSNG